MALVCEDRSHGPVVEPPGQALREARHPSTGRCPSCAVLQEVQNPHLRFSCLPLMAYQGAGSVRLKLAATALVRSG